MEFRDFMLSVIAFLSLAQLFAICWMGDILIKWDKGRE